MELAPKAADPRAHEYLTYLLLQTRERGWQLVGRYPFFDHRCRLLSHGLSDLLGRDVGAEPAECRRLLVAFTLKLTAAVLQKSLDLAQVCDLYGRKSGRVFVRGNRLQKGSAELGKQEGLRGELRVFHRG